MSPKMALVLLLVVALASASLGVRAEGNCPRGYYPIGGQGVQGCAPIPGSGSTSSSPAAVPSAPVPTGEWIKTWGAIAASKATSDAGVSTAKFSRQDAEREALGKCADRGARDCAVSLAYFNQCVSWVIPSGRSGKGQSGIGRGPTLDVAKEAAAKSCKNDEAGSCVEVYADCTEPYFKKY